ncbi:MAG TPA: hypothetical protein PLY52_10660 [Methanothrix sp.]|jgi:hypothetical protein|uniref:hypothetical protein n=1 Tax=Methanothrix sp. TaxID=90426 RepID=UPI002CA4CA9A|nr:hypothetical protein [Methanothrix sp.]MDI9418060.1 hypothetical protein [Euryarchaeota archaeon]HON36753.1 hypothetical protein [Methanothrix sp.]HRU76233.1 hypothetical protein [Methanothrix sp.]
MADILSNSNPCAADLELNFAFHASIMPPAVFHISGHACCTVFKNPDANEVKI